VEIRSHGGLKRLFQNHLILKRTTRAMMHAMVQRPALTVLGVLLVTACDQISPAPVPPPVPPPRPVDATRQVSSGPDTPWSGHPVVPPCHQPIEKACGAAGCSTYDVAVDEAKALAPKLVFSCFAAAGTCGDLRYVQVADGFISNTSYFDESGKMVAAVHMNDGIDAKCRGRSGCDRSERPPTSIGPSLFRSSVPLRRGGTGTTIRDRSRELTGTARNYSPRFPLPR
jgi:hypothetical protein